MMTMTFDGTHIDGMLTSSLMERYIADRMEKNYKYSVLNPQVYDLILMDEMMRGIDKPYLLVDTDKKQTATEACLAQTLDFNDHTLVTSLFNHWLEHVREYIEHAVANISPVRISKEIAYLSQNVKKHFDEHLKLHKRTVDFIYTRITDKFMTKVFNNEFVIDNLILVTDDSRSSTIYSIVKQLILAVNNDIVDTYRTLMPLVFYTKSHPQGCV